MLARAITLIESTVPAFMEQAQAVLQALMPHTGKSVRIGITGVPGAGKSTLIEALGLMLEDADDGQTRYTAIARHRTPETRARHEAMGFHEGWGTVVTQLEGYAQGLMRP